eukprot:Unigene5316_Nuclearia_a/m.16311 Unigene5316_Nuclearia_a/g.16311  ORF Unigene5316_Nuclearia_a/g.16311 Unigene5316_Nuclearia_a/m.16311 type:complete len:309 (+) Unigene5316_Nuclearia_a:491-1417(+)
MYSSRKRFWYCDSSARDGISSTSRSTAAISRFFFDSSLRMRCSFALSSSNCASICRMRSMSSSSSFPSFSMRWILPLRSSSCLRQVTLKSFSCCSSASIVDSSARSCRRIGAFSSVSSSSSLAVSLTMRLLYLSVLVTAAWYSFSSASSLSCASLTSLKRFSCSAICFSSDAISRRCAWAPPIFCWFSASAAWISAYSLAYCLIDSDSRPSIEPSIDCDTELPEPSTRLICSTSASMRRRSSAASAAAFSSFSLSLLFLVDSAGVVPIQRWPYSSSVLSTSAEASAAVIRVKRTRGRSWLLRNWRAGL